MCSVRQSLLQTFAIHRVLWCGSPSSAVPLFPITRCRRRDRASACWTEAVGSAEPSVQRTLRLPLSEATGGVVGAAGRFQGRPPLDRGGLARNCGDRQSPEEAAFSRLLGTGEAQVGVRVNTYVYSSSTIFVPAQVSLHRVLRKPRRIAPGSTLLRAAL